MNWYAGNIAEAVKLAKTRNAIFVVYVEGTDALSQKLSSIINEDAVRQDLGSSAFVAIKIQSESEAYVQFAQIYKLVPLPSIFFIGSNGTPIDIVTGVIASSQELRDRIKNVADRAGIQIPPQSSATNVGPSTTNAGPSTTNLVPSTTNVVPSPANVRPSASGPSTQAPAASASTASEEVVCENGVCRKVSANPEPSNPNPNEDKIQLAKELLEKKKKEKENEEAKRLKEEETQRRQLGRDLQSFRERQHEIDLLQRKEERQRDKLADQAARKRILDQIAQDRADRAQRLNLGGVSHKPEVDSAKKYVPPKVNADFTRIQFKKPDGESEMHTFNASDKFCALRSYVADTVLGGAIKDFDLATTFPRKQYTVDDNDKTMSELDLIPSAVLLILINEKPRTSLPAAVTNIRPLGLVNNMFWGAFTQILSIFNYLKRLVWRTDNRETGAQKRASEESQSANDMAKRRNLRHPLDNQAPNASRNPSGVPYRRPEGSNIHRLHENKDSDDENNTWNGNSTQQQ